MSEKNQDFTTIKNKIINSGSISLKGLGLLLFLRSKTTDWRFSILNICNELKDGRESITSAVQELERLKIIERKKTKNKKGQFEFTFIFLDDEKPSEKVEEPKLKPKPKRTPVKKTPPKKEEPKAEENLFPEPPKEEPPTPPTPPTTPDEGKLYSEMVKIYFEWFEGLSGVKPKFGQAEGASLKQIINYFKILYKDNHSEGENEFEEVTKMFQYIFKFWHLIDPFLQKQTKVTQINSNIQNIINDIKNGHKRKSSNNKDKSEHARGERLQKSFNRIDEMLFNKKQN